MVCKISLDMWLWWIGLGVEVGCSAKEGEEARVFCQCGSGFGAWIISRKAAGIAGKTKMPGKNSSPFAPLRLSPRYSELEWLRLGSRRLGEKEGVNRSELISGFVVDGLRRKGV